MEASQLGEAPGRGERRKSLLVNEVPVEIGEGGGRREERFAVV